MATITTTVPQTTTIDPAAAGIEPRYENFIGGDWVAPTTGLYDDNPTPATGERFTRHNALPTPSPAGVLSAEVESCAP